MDPRYTAEAVTDWLAANLPTWTLADDHLTRTYGTGGWQMSLQVANTIGYLAEIGWHHPELIVTYPSVTVRLQSHDAGGITDKDFQLAAKIEETVMWSPGTDEALTGHADRKVS